jgi:hypothetical protein
LIGADGNQFTRHQLDLAGVARLCELVDLGNVDHPPAAVAVDLDMS